MQNEHNLAILEAFGILKLKLYPIWPMYGIHIPTFTININHSCR